MAGEKRTTALQREVQGYLKPSYFIYFNAYRELNAMGKSEALNFMVRFFFDSMPAEERQRLLEAAKQAANVQEETFV